VSHISSILGFAANPSIDSVGIIEIALKPRPSLVQNFIGRRDILEAMVHTHITSRSTDLTTPAITVLSGLGGSGKTQTALKFALEFETR
jgi:signal recognition particle GTPase